jgi:hypothetical protein
MTATNTDFAQAGLIQNWSFATEPGWTQSPKCWQQGYTTAQSHMAHINCKTL